MIFTFGYRGAHTGFGIKPGDTGAPGPHPLSQSALRREFNFQLATQVLPHKFSIFAHIRRDHLFDLPCFQQTPEAKTVGSRVIAGGGNSGCTGIAQCFNQRFGNATQTKAAHSDFHTVKHRALQGLCGAVIDFFHNVSLQICPRTTSVAA